MGFFEKAGLNVQVQTFSSGAEAAEAVIGGSPDLAITTPLLLANGYLRGLPFAIVAAGPIATTKSPSTLLCVAANGPIHSAQDLIGQTVGLNVLNTVLALSLDAYLEANKVPISAVKTVEIAFPAEPPAIERGTIAAAILPEPFLASATQKGSIRSLANPNIYIAPRFLLGAWFTSRQFAQRQMVRATFADHMDPTDIQALLDAAVRYGVLSKHLRATDLIVS
jgi:NitT/TauT family transport system substrate-binding protein